jgi:hypothetical protein
MCRRLQDSEQRQARRTRMSTFGSGPRCTGTRCCRCFCGRHFALIELTPAGEIGVKTLLGSLVPEDTSNDILCFLKRDIASAAEELKINMYCQDDRVALVPQSCMLPAARAESFAYQLAEGVYRRAICLRPFESHSTLRKHEAMSEMQPSQPQGHLTTKSPEVVQDEPKF